MSKPQMTNFWEEDTTWKAYIKFSRNLSCFVAMMISLMFAGAGAAAFVYVGLPVFIFVFLVMLLGKALSDGCDKLYRYLYDLDA